MHGAAHSLFLMAAIFQILLLLCGWMWATGIWKARNNYECYREVTCFKLLRKKKKGVSFDFPPNPGVETRSPTLQADSLPSESPGKPKKVLVVQSFLTLCNSTDHSLPGSSVDGIFQARILEWVAIPSWGDLSDPEIEPRSYYAQQADSLPSEPPGKAQEKYRDVTCFKLLREKDTCLSWCFKEKKSHSGYVWTTHFRILLFSNLFSLAKADGLFVSKKQQLFYCLNYILCSQRSFFHAIRPGNLPSVPKYQRWWCHDRCDYLTMEENAMETEHLKQQNFLQHSQLKCDPNILP